MSRRLRRAALLALLATLAGPPPAPPTAPAPAGILALARAALGPRALAAQQPRVITLREAIALAMERNTDVLRARADVDLRGIQETRERMDFLPELELGMRGRRSFGRSFSQEEGAILSESSDIFDADVSASVQLFDGLNRIASVRAASLREEASRLRFRRAREDVVFDVVQGFTTLVMDRELAGVREEELAAAAELLAEVRRLVDLGRQPLSDLYQQQAVHAEAEAALVDARRQVELSETALLQVLQLDPLAAWEFRAPTPPEAAAEPVAYELDALLEQAFDRRADLTALERGLAASGQGVTAARSGWWPSLSLSFDYGSNWTSTTAGVAFLEQLDGRRGGTVSLSLGVPLFDRLQTRTAVAEAEVERLNAAYALQDRRQEVALEVRQALLDYRSAVARQAATDRRLEAAERAWDAAQRRYELGAATFVEVAQSRSGLVAARSAAVRARFAALLAQRVIAYFTGGLDPDGPLLPDQPGEPLDD